MISHLDFGGSSFSYFVQKGNRKNGKNEEEKAGNGESGSLEKKKEKGNNALWWDDMRMLGNFRWK